MKIYLTPDKKVFRLITPMPQSVRIDDNGKRIVKGFDGDWGRLARDLEPVQYGVQIVKL